VLYLWPIGKNLDLHLKKQDFLQGTREKEKEEWSEPAEKPDAQSNLQRDKLMSAEILEFYDEQERPLGQAQRHRLHSEGLYHKGVIILIFNSKGEIFLQKRSKSKDVCPGCWDGGVAGHVEIGEEFSETAIRELREEIGAEANLERIRDTHLQKNEYKKWEIKDYEFVVTFRCVYDGPIKVDQSEIGEAGFFSVQDVEKQMNEGTEFTPWFLDEWNYLIKSGKLRSQ